MPEDKQHQQGAGQHQQGAGQHNQQRAGQHGQDDNNRNRQQEQQDDRRGGSGNFANDRERASEAGRKGGQH